MKILIFFLVIALAACANKSKNKISGADKLSKGEYFLNSIRDSFESSYFSTRSEVEKEKILKEYHDRLLDHLMRYRLDSIRVKVDEVIVNGWAVTTRFHCNTIQFQYGFTFGKDMIPRLDSVYKFMKGLRPGSDTSVNFDFTGACVVNRPDNRGVPEFRIFAFPIPLAFNGK